MKFKKVLLSLFMVASTYSNAQEIKKEVLFTIDDKPYYTDEFVRVYKKNLDLVKDDSQKDLNQYLDLFIGYKLKVNKAYKLGLETNSAYINELRSYRTQLARNYTTDSKVTKELIEEAYKRSLLEVNASHILFNVGENADPSDTLRVYNQAIEVRKQILNGASFEEMAQKYSQDPSVKENSGSLGWFSVFKMVYPFESAAYNTPVGQVSMPVRTRFGYHLVKVNKTRENRGEVTVAHIMLLNGATPEENEKAKSSINEIYKKLQQGESFEVLAQQLSQDKSSSGKGGHLQKFASGDLSSEEFENVAFSLKEREQISEPFQTQFGWHIIKLLEKNPIKPLPEVEAEFDNKIRKDDRSKLINKALNDKVIKKYPVKRNDKLYVEVKKEVKETYYNGTWVLPENMKYYNKELVKINNDRVITGSSFLNYLMSQQKTNPTIKPLGKLVDFFYDKFLVDQLANYYNDNLENEFPEFANVMEEYKDGLLLFDLMEKEIWMKAKTDTIGLKSFYDANRMKYQWKDRVQADVFSSTKEDVIKKTQQYLKKDKTVEYIKEKLNKDNVVDVIEKTGIYEINGEGFPKHKQIGLGVTDIVHEGNYYFVSKINQILPKGDKTLEEAKGRVINDYQQYLENNWVAELKKEFTVKVNQDVFQRVKSQLQTK